MSSFGTSHRQIYCHPEKEEMAPVYYYEAIISISVYCILVLCITIIIIPKKNTSHGNEVLPQDTRHLIQRPCYQRGSPCQDPAGNWTTRRSPGDFKEMQTAVVWSCFPFIRSGQNPSCKAQWKGEEDKADKGRGGKTFGNGQAWIIIIYPLTTRVVGAPQMILQLVSSIFLCYPLPSRTWQTQGLSISWCCLPTSSACLVFFPLSLCLARWFWPDLMNGRHVHTTAVYISLQWSGSLRVVWLPAGSWHRLSCW